MAYYSLAGNANDSSGDGYNGTVYGATPTSDRFGNPNNALLFNGNGEYVSTVPSAAIPSSITVGMWIDPTSFGGSQGSQLWGSVLNPSCCKNGFDAGIGSNGGIYFYRWYQDVGPNDLSAGAGTISLDQWQYVTFTADNTSGNADIYVNGIEVASGGGFSMASEDDEPLMIGVGIYEQSAFFVGSIDDVSVYNNALSSSEVQTLYSDGGTLPVQAGGPSVATLSPGLTGPGSIAIAGSGDIWISNDNATISELTPSGSLIGTYSDASPTGTESLSIDAYGDIWGNSGGTSSSTVVEMSASGAILGTHFLSTGTVASPAIDGSGDLWIASYGAGSVTELNSGGSVVMSYAEPSYGPTAVVVDGYGNLWIPGYNTNNVTKMTAGGSYYGPYSAATTPDGGVAIDQSGNVWIASGNGTGTTVTEVSPTGTDIGTFPVGTNPIAIAIDNAGDVWVANSGSNNVTELSRSGGLLNDYSVGTTPAGIAIDTSGDVWVTDQGSNTITEIVDAASGPQFFPYSGPQWPDSD